MGKAGSRVKKLTVRGACGEAGGGLGKGLLEKKPAWEEGLAEAGPRSAQSSSPAGTGVRVRTASPQYPRLPHPRVQQQYSTTTTSIVLGIVSNLAMIYSIQTDCTVYM